MDREVTERSEGTRKTFQCVDCKQIKEVSETHGPGYARRTDNGGPNGKVCYDCCAIEDLAYMKQEGKIALYVTERRHFRLDTQQMKGGVDTTTGSGNPPGSDRAKRGNERKRPIRISNWPGSLSFVIHQYRYSDHNFTGRQGRLDIWFHYDGHVWHGVNIGDSMILRCKRTQKEIQCP